MFIVSLFLATDEKIWGVPSSVPHNGPDKHTRIKEIKEGTFPLFFLIATLIWACSTQPFLTKRGNLSDLFSPFLRFQVIFHFKFRWKPSEPPITVCVYVGCQGSLKDTLAVPTLTTSEKPLSNLLNLALSHWSPLEQFRVCGGAEWLQGSSPVFDVNYRFTQKWIFVFNASEGRYC